MKVLIVDDQEENVYLLESLLKGSGYEVASAANGAEALEKLRAEGIDAIISDILMPVMDGFQLCRECKGDEELKLIPFVFYTATYTDGRDEDFALKLGADRYVRKPIEPGDFIKIIQGVLRDAEAGKIAVKKPPLEEEEEIFKLYNQRLVAKLERKMLALEEEMTERKRAEERIVHLNAVLRAIRRVNQLIVTEKDRDTLLKGACENLIETRGYYNAWIALIDQSGKLVTTAEAGLGEDFLPLVEDLKRGQLPHCASRALSEPGVLTIEDPSSTCEGCPLVGMYAGRAGRTCRLETDGNIYGLLTISVTPDYAADEEERSLFDEVVGDIGFALRGMELERERRRAEEALQESERNYRALVENLPQRIFLKDRNSVYTSCNQSYARDLGIGAGEIAGKTDYDFYPEELADRYRADDRSVVESGETVDVEESYIKDGKELWVHTVKTPVTDASGNVVAILGIFWDITDRKRAEEELRRTFSRLQKIVAGAVQTMARIVEIRDPYTAGHQQRVAALAGAIAVELHLPEDQVAGLYMAGSIHDVGKISVPAEILSKPGRLTDTEFEIIKAHSFIGYDILSGIEFPWPIADIVLQHHERMDGSGYPKGLTGEDIRLEARILGVADVVEAMASHRPYRPARGLDVALEEISQNKGVLYDPQVADACLRLFAEKGFKLE